jgi:integrase
MGELLELRWRYVSFERATVTVAASWSGGEVTPPKSRKPRTVPLATPLAAELARLADRRWFTSADDLVFCSTLGDHLDPSALRRRLRRAQDAAGLRPLRFHDLRHSAAPVGTYSKTTRTTRPRRCRPLARTAALCRHPVAGVVTYLTVCLGAQPR